MTLSKLDSRAIGPGAVALALTRTELKTLHSTVETIFLMEAGREGIFKWTAGNFSTHIAADTAEGVYVKATAIAATVGAWVRQGVNQTIVAEWFGAIGYTQARLEELDGAAQVDTDAAANDVAWAAALSVAKFLGGKDVLGAAQFYVRTATRAIGEGCGVEGGGVGNWEPIFPTRPKTWEGTTHLMKGSVPGARTISGITSQEHGGGWRPDPDSPGDYFKLFSAYNADATGTTPATQKSFSAGFTNETNARYLRMRNFRVANWSGQNGIEGHSDTGSIALGNDCDFGILLVNCEYANVENVQGVGDFREAGRGFFIDNTTSSHGERNNFQNCKWQGRVGSMFRAPDRWLITTPPTWSGSAGTVTIRFTSESYWGTTGTFRDEDGVNYTYTGVTHAGADAAFVFTGVTPNPTNATEVRHPSTGVANTQAVNDVSYGLDHVSGLPAASLGLADSKAIEVSGERLRGLKFINAKWHTGEPVIRHFHDCSDLSTISCQPEGGGHLIASPVRSSQSWAAAPLGDTRGLVELDDDGTAEQDARLFTPRNPFVQSLMLSPRTELDSNFRLRPFGTGNSVLIEAPDGTDFFDCEEKTWAPGWGFVTVTHTVQDGRYIQIGKLVYFAIELAWTGLDTADTTVLTISLPVVADLDKPVSGQILERTSTGINMSTLTRPYLDLSTGGGLSVTHNRTSRVAYNTASIMAAAGILSVIGTYWAA